MKLLPLIALTGLPLVSFADAPAIVPTPSDKPSPAQRAQIDRKYGMFCHYGINTFVNMEWSDGKLPPGKYAPPADLADGIDDWVKTARDAGMRYFICITKHHDGFCLWDSKYTDYDVANPAVKNHLDVVGAIAKACKKYGLTFCVYYSLWDRHEPSYGDAGKYRDYMIGQLTELLTNYGPVGEVWFDGSWDKPGKDWFVPEVYATIKKLQPDCLVSVNHTIGDPANQRAGTHPSRQREGDTIRYFPSDFRLADPHLPRADDPKLFTHDGKTYYLPFESTVTVSAQDKWFHDTRDTKAKSVDALARVFRAATRNDNTLVLNVPPARDGRLVPAQKQALLDLAKKLDLGPGKPFPTFAVQTGGLKIRAEADSVWPQKGFEADRAVDGDPDSRWAAKDPVASLTLTLEKPTRIASLIVSEYEENGVYRAKRHKVSIPDGAGWKTIVSGGGLGESATLRFAPVTTDRIRLTVEGDAPVSLYEVTTKAD